MSDICVKIYRLNYEASTDRFHYSVDSRELIRQDDFTGVCTVLGDEPIILDSVVVKNNSAYYATESNVNYDSIKNALVNAIKVDCNKRISNANNTLHALERSIIND